MAKSTERNFESVSVIVAGAQRAADRFDKLEQDLGHEFGPPVSSWRCNLTGLSQTHNLFFVACVDNLYVYKPQFPSQNLPKRPSLIIPSVPSQSGLRGYLDVRNPHSVNNLTVQFLGSDEIIATVRDDGDVDAILVRHILQAIHRRAEPGNTLGLWAHEVKPIFQSNVGKSAWGLAIHTQARIIATSANTHNITVFKFGLIETDEIASVSAEQRGTDVTETVLNGNSNIPHIAFCNTGDDPSARWLLTTDISGYCRTIDLHDMTTSQVFRFGQPLTHMTLNAMDPINPGWAITFLDRRSFLPEDSFHAALGLRDREQLPGGNENHSVWDISATVESIADRSVKFSAQRLRRRRSRTPTASVNQTGTTRRDTATTEAVRAEARSGSITSSPSTTASRNDWETESSASDEDDYRASFDFDDEGTEDSPSFGSFYGGRRIFGNAPHFYIENPLCGDLPCPILHASLRNVYLLQPSSHMKMEYDARRGNITRSPTIGFANALHQSISTPDAYLNVFERLNMIVSIPSIGVVVLASQKGRAIVLSLTKIQRAAAATYPATLGSFAESSIYAMRIEHVLPFASQEAARQRPAAPLMGLAAAPVQGTQDLPPAQQVRWRLMLTYADHSILSYEVRGRRLCQTGERSHDLAGAMEGLVV